MISFTFFICIVIVRCGVIGSNSVPQYEDSMGTEESTSDEEESKYYTTPSLNSSEEASIEHRIFPYIFSLNKKSHAIWRPGSLLTGIFRPFQRRPTPKAPHTAASSPPTTTTSTTRIPSTTTTRTTTAKPTTTVKPVIIALDDVLEKLEAAIILRENTITVMGYILQLPRGRLTSHQYTSLEMIYNALRQRSVYLYNLLPVLKKMEGKSESIQFAHLLNKLSRAAPPYLSSSIKYWIKQINHKKIDLNNLLSMKGSSNLLTGISKKAIRISSIRQRKKHRKRPGKGSRRKKERLDKIYGKIIQQLSLTDAKLPQLLFGIILLNLPNPGGDPIFEEYVKYIAEEAKHQKIPNWNSHGRNQKSGNPHILLTDIVHKIWRDAEVPLKMKKVLLYILIHYESSRDEHSDDPLTHSDNNLKSIFLSVAPLNYVESINQLGLQLQSSLKNDSRFDEILDDVNRYTYRHPSDQILAYLAKVQTKLTDEDVKMERLVSALLSNLILIRGISAPVAHYIPLWIVIDVIDEPEADPKIREMINYITHEMYQNVALWDALQQIITLDKDQCVQPKTCVLNALNNLEKILTKEDVEPKVIASVKMLINLGYQDLQKEEHNKLNWLSTISSTAADYEEPSIFDRVDEFFATHSTPQPTTPTQPPATSPKPLPVLPKFSAQSKLPSSVDPSKCIIFIKPLSGPPAVRTLLFGVDSEVPGAIVLPSVFHFEEKPSNNSDFVDECYTQLKRTILDHLIVIFGDHYITTILDKPPWSHHFPTMIALLIEVLRKATWNNEVQSQPELMQNIEEVLEALEFVGPYILFPLVAHFMDFDQPVTWVTFGNNTDETFRANFKKDIVYFARSPPDSFQNGSLSTMPLVNPKYWLEPIGAGDPFPSLLPQLPKNSTYEIALRPLVSVFQASILTPLLGDDMIPSWYPNKGALFIWTLRRLRTSDIIKSDKVLLDLIENYLRIILPPSIYVRVPSNLITGSMHESSGRWTVDLLGLMKALPIPNTTTETGVWDSMRDFLSKINLLDKLEVHLPPSKTPKGQFLTTIIKAALKSPKVAIDERIRRALLYYEDKVLHDGEGAAHVNWIWIQKFLLSSKVHIGQTIVEVLPYDNIPLEKKGAYQEFVTHLANNPHLLEMHNELSVGSNNTKGAFVHDYLLYLLKERHLPQDARKSITELLPYVTLTGQGARALPPVDVDAVH